LIARPAVLEGSVAEAMVREPHVHGLDATAGELRVFFVEHNVQVALIVADTLLVSVVDPWDLIGSAADAPAWERGRLRGRTVRPGTRLADAVETMTSAGNRRLAVVDGEGLLLGLLCLKRHHRGFCSDEEVRAHGREHHPHHHPAGAGDQAP
jgi:predicted transcriptional regulator